MNDNFYEKMPTYKRTPNEKPMYRLRVNNSKEPQSYYTYYPYAAKNQVWFDFVYYYKSWEVIIRENQGVLSIYDIFDKYKKRIKEEKFDSIPLIGDIIFAFRKDKKFFKNYYTLMEFMSAMNINTMSLTKYKEYGENLQQIFEDRLMDTYLKRKFLAPGEESLPHVCRETKKHKKPTTVEEL